MKTLPFKCWPYLFVLAANPETSLGNPSPQTHLSWYFTRMESVWVIDSRKDERHVASLIYDLVRLNTEGGFRVSEKIQTQIDSVSGIRFYYKGNSVMCYRDEKFIGDYADELNLILAQYQGYLAGLNEGFNTVSYITDKRVVSLRGYV